MMMKSRIANRESRIAHLYTCACTCALSWQKQKQEQKENKSKGVYCPIRVQ